MELIALNEDLINMLSDKLTILDSQLSKIDIFEDENEELIIDIYLKLCYSKPKGIKVKIRFIGIEEYSFFYTKDRYFYFIQRLKLFKKEHHYYLSMDPVDEKEEISVEDQDFILCNSIEGYFI
ncbi:hypothetical protein [Chitinophaga sp.]|uniref:hypothetical protein n=1 Tax=Chitinophaga sp. TaxID=1869181 RepID=UPI0031D8F464